MVWGKVIGALAGFVLGHGLLGMLAGALAGHWVDSWFARRFPNPEMVRRKQVFLTAVTCLAAKLSKADGPVNRAEVDAFKAQFRFGPGEMTDVARLYDEAKLDAAGFEPYARSLRENFAAEPFLLAEIFGALFRIAAVDGGPNDAEMRVLERVAEILGLSFHAQYDPPPRTRTASGNDPYSVLKVPRNAPMSEIKAAWRKLSREHHPDNLIAKGVPEDYVAIANQKMAEINAAYDAIRQERGEA
jgi:DnaJ like chaperone protein